jgi:hypothetical protein
MRSAFLGAVGALAVFSASASAAPLNRAACKGLKVEREALIAKGIKADIAKGPAWGKASLGPARLDEIRRFIELNEQLTFRCGRRMIKLGEPEKGKNSKKKRPGTGHKIKGKPSRIPLPLRRPVISKGPTQTPARPAASTPDTPAQFKKARVRKSKSSAKTKTSKKGARPRKYVPPPSGLSPRPGQNGP